MVGLRNSYANAKDTITLFYLNANKHTLGYRSVTAIVIMADYDSYLLETVLELVLCRRDVKSHTGAGEENKGEETRHQPLNVWSLIIAYPLKVTTIRLTSGFIPGGPGAKRMSI